MPAQGMENREPSQLKHSMENLIKEYLREGVEIQKV